METDNSLMTKIAHRTNILREITKGESIELKRILVEMLSDLSNLCQKYDLDLILVGGSALGAVRHNGFIPWDDDLDVGLSRKDYDKLINLIEKGYLDKKYDFSYPNKRSDSKNLFLKIFKKGTVFSEITDTNANFPKGVFLDVFPIENAPIGKYTQKIKGFISDLLSFISVSVLYYEYPSRQYADFMSTDSAALKRYNQRMMIGKIAKLFGSHKTWVNRFNRFAQRNKPTSLMTIPTGRKHYVGEILPSNIFFPSSVGNFEGLKIGLPHDQHKYLKNLYGDYMIIPPEDKRERHYIVDMKLH